MTYHAFKENDNRWVDQEADPTEAVFAETFNDLPWELRDEQDFPSMGDELVSPIAAVTL